MSIIISFAAFLVSAFTFYSNWNAKKFNIEIEVIASYEAFVPTPSIDNGFVVRIIFKNKSNQPITLVNANIDNYFVQRHNQIIGKGYEKILINSNLPLTFLPYEGKEINLYFPADYNDRLDYINSKVFKIHTTRGIHEFDIDLNETNQDTTELFKLYSKTL